MVVGDNSVMLLSIYKNKFIFIKNKVKWTNKLIVDE